jgi:hypothetical protein
MALFSALPANWSDGQEFHASDENNVETALNTLQNAYVPSGTDVAIADGGTGAGTAAAALTNLKAVAGSVNGTATALTLWTGTTAQYNAIGSGNYSTTTVYIVTP